MLAMAIIMGNFAVTGNHVYASTEKQNMFINNSEILDDFFSAKEKRYAVNLQGDDCTDVFLNRTEKLYKNREFQEIKRIMAEEAISLHVIKSNGVANKPLNEVSPYAYNKQKRVTSDYMSGVIFDTYRATTLEYQVELAGVITYNPNTDEVKAVSSPQLYVHEMTSSVFGAIERHYADKTSAKVQNGKGYFWASTHFAAQASQDGVTFLYDYGVKSFSFYAVP